MKRVVQFITSSFFTLLLLGSCSKNEIDFSKLPISVKDTSAYIMWNVSGVEQTNKPLYALVTIVNTDEEPVVTDKKITLDQVYGSFKTDKIQLSKGLYKLSKFIVVEGSDTALYAVPKANSIKASQTATALPGNFSISNFGITDVNISVSKINPNDMPESFGYTHADFGLHSWTTLDVKLAIHVGQTIYDSLPGTLQIDAVNADGQHWIREISLQKGITRIQIPKQYVTYAFKVNKWNVTAEREISQQQLQSNMLLNLQAVRQPKRLIEEASFLLNQNDYQPESKSEFLYDANRLVEIRNYQKSTIVSGLPLTNTLQFIYKGNQLDSIKRFDPNYILNGYTSFAYMGSSISGIHNTSYDQFTGASIEYTGTGENSATQITYLFHNGNSMLYTLFMKNGNKVSDQSQSSTGGSESGYYEYDTNINPKYNLGFPDLYFSNSSKNNLTLQQKNYAGAIPTVVPYKFEYVYDNDGYPVEVYISYKGFTSQQHLYTIKKTYKYQ